MAGARILGVVIHKLSHWQELCPIILLEVDEGSKIGLHSTVLLFCLPVFLRVEGSGKLPLNAEKVA